MLVVAGFEQAIQGYAIHVLSITYERLPRTILAEVDSVSCCVNCFEHSLQNDDVFNFSISILYFTLRLIIDNWQAINVEGLSLDKFLEHQVSNNGWALEKSGQVDALSTQGSWPNLLLYMCWLLSFLRDIEMFRYSSICLKT